MGESHAELNRRPVLVTGGLGYVGSVLVPLLAQRGPVRVYDSMMFGNALEGTPGVEFVKGDIRDQLALSGAMQGCEAVMHLAGIVTDDLVAMNPTLAKEVNEEATRSLCELAVAAGVSRLVYASSSSVYGTQDGVCTEASPTRPMTAYAHNKLVAERICLTYADRMCVTAVRSATCMGPAPRMRLDTIVNVFSKQAFFDREITVHGGGQFRSNVHVRDVAELYALLLELPEERIGGKMWNASYSSRMALDIAGFVSRAIFSRLHREVQVKVRTDITDDRHYRMDASQVTRDIGWEPKRKITDAARDNFEWFVAGKVDNPNDDLWYNTRRMAAFMKGVNRE